MELFRSGEEVLTYVAIADDLAAGIRWVSVFCHCFEFLI